MVAGLFGSNFWHTYKPLARRRQSTIRRVTAPFTTHKPYFQQGNEVCAQHVLLEIVFKFAKQFLGWYLSHRAYLGHYKNCDCMYHGILMIYPDNWRYLDTKFGKIPFVNFIQLCHVGWKLDSRIDVDQNLWIFRLCSLINNSIVLKF